MKKILIASAAAAAIVMTGCGSSSSSNDTATEVEEGLPEGLTLIMFDNASSEQYSFNTELQTVVNMNDENYDMTGKNGKLVVWTDHEEENGEEVEEQKVAMLNDVEYNIDTDANVTKENIHYLGHVHDEAFVAHSAEDVEVAELNSLSADLREREVVRGELEEALDTVNADGDLCNFFVLGEHEYDGDTDEEASSPHIALTTDGYLYVFDENTTTGELTQDGVHFLLEAMNCTENESDIFQIEENGVAIFSAEQQTLYLVDKHEADEAAEFGTTFHMHTKVKMSEISQELPADFTPTSVVSIGEGEHDHEDE